MNYSTQDIYLAGYLVANDQKLSHTSTEAGSMTFQFPETGQLLQLVESYYDLQAVVNPQRYGYALKVLKNLLYRNKNKNNEQYTMSHELGRTR